MRSKRPVLEGEVLLDDRSERRLERFRWGRLLFVVALVSVVAGMIGLYFSPFLRVQTVEVTGTSVVSIEEVLGLATGAFDQNLQSFTDKPLPTFQSDRALLLENLLVSNPCHIFRDGIGELCRRCSLFRAINEGS